MTIRCYLYVGVYFAHVAAATTMMVPDNVATSVVYHPNTGHLAGIGKLPALAGWYIRLVLRK
jgi:hypothetical protein